MSEKNNFKGLNTICTHVGQVKDEQFGGSVSPIYPGTSYEYIDKEIDRYPRYSSTPNQEFLAKKIAALEGTEDAMIFGSGMAAISTSLLAFLRARLRSLFKSSTSSIPTENLTRFTDIPCFLFSSFGNHLCDVKYGTLIVLSTPAKLIAG